MVKSGLHPLVLDANMSNRGVFSRGHSVFDSVEIKHINCKTLTVRDAVNGNLKVSGNLSVVGVSDSGGGTTVDASDSRATETFQETQQDDGTFTTTATVADGGEVRYETGLDADGTDQGVGGGHGWFMNTESFGCPGQQYHS